MNLGRRARRRNGSDFEGIVHSKTRPHNDHVAYNSAGNQVRRLYAWSGKSLLISVGLAETDVMLGWLHDRTRKSLGWLHASYDEGIQSKITLVPWLSVIAPVRYLPFAITLFTFTSKAVVKFPFDRVSMVVPRRLCGSVGAPGLMSSGAPRALFSPSLEISAFLTATAASTLVTPSGLLR